MAFTPFTKDDLPTMAAFNEKLQAIFDDAESKAKIEVGSYVGTGTYGSSNPNTLTFGFEPKIILFDNAGAWPFINPKQTSIYDLVGATSSFVINISWNGNSVSWYSDDYHSYQLNTAGETYYYIAIG